MAKETGHLLRVKSSKTAVSERSLISGAARENSPRFTKTPPRPAAIRHTECGSVQRPSGASNLRVYGLGFWVLGLGIGGDAQVRPCARKWSFDRALAPQRCLLSTTRKISYTNPMLRSSNYRERTRWSGRYAVHRRLAGSTNGSLRF